MATEYGTLAASPLGSFPLGSLNIADLPLGSFPLGSFEVNGAPLGSFPLGSFDLIGSPLGSFPLGSFSSLDAIIDDPTGLCAACQTLADAARAGVISASATLADLALSSEFAATTLGEVLDAMTLAILYGPGTLADIEDTGNLTLGQLLIAMMLKTGFPWETIPAGSTRCAGILGGQLYRLCSRHPADRHRVGAVYHSGNSCRQFPVCSRQRFVGCCDAG